MNTKEFKEPTSRADLIPILIHIIDELKRIDALFEAAFAKCEADMAR